MLSHRGRGADRCMSKPNPRTDSRKPASRWSPSICMQATQQHQYWTLRVFDCQERRSKLRIVQIDTRRTVRRLRAPNASIANVRPALQTCETCFSNCASVVNIQVASGGELRLQTLRYCIDIERADLRDVSWSSSPMVSITFV